MVAALALASAWGCGSKPPTQPPTVVIPQLVITCPASVVVDSADGLPVRVSYATPEASGGQGTLTTACSAPSGSLFNGGTTTVGCVVTDARGVSAFCSLSVFVRVPPRLIGTARLLAFGDSITAGVPSDPLTGQFLTASPFAYPLQLEPMLRIRYKLQSPSIINEGIPGEEAHLGGVSRIRSVLLQHRPDAMLLMEGTNDLLGPLGADRAMEGLTAIVREAKLQSVRVVIATIPPQRLGGLRNRHPGVVNAIPGFNDRIRALAAAEGLTLADVYAAMKDDLSLIGQDDLHPTPRGFEVIAQVFAKAIEAGLEQPHPPATIR